MPELIQALNSELRKLEEAVREVRTKPAVSNDLDMAGFRIKNLGKSRAAGDATPKIELQERALYENDLGQHVAHSTILAKDGIRSASQARDGDDLVPLRQVKKLIGAGVGAPNAVLTTDVDQSILGFKRFFSLGILDLAITCVAGNNGVLNIQDRLGGFLRMRGATGDFTVDGFSRPTPLSGGYTGQLLIVYNSTNFVMTLRHNIGSLTSAFRLPQANPTATASMTIRRFGSVIMIYSISDSRWVCASFA